MNRSIFAPLSRVWRAAVCGAAILGAVASFAVVPFARADMQVLESNADSYPVGKRLPDGTQPKLQPGESVKVLLLPSNRTQVFEGPRGKPPGSAGGTRGAIKRREPGGLPSANPDEKPPN